MAAAAAASPPAPVTLDGAGRHVVSLEWDWGVCDLRLSSSVHRRDDDDRRRPSLRLHRELHMWWFRPDGSPCSYGYADELPDRVRSVARLFSPTRHARAVFFDDVVREMEFAGLPEEAVDRVVGTALSYLRDLAASTLLPAGAGATSTYIWVDVEVHVRVQLETSPYGVGGGHLRSPPRATEQVLAEEGEEEGERCAICLEGIGGGGRRRTQWLPCLHGFHDTCIERWLVRKAECPLCRFQLVPGKSFFLYSHAR